jgi:hypothetical protein
MTRGSVKKPPEKNATTVGAPSTQAVATKSTALRIGGQANAVELESAPRAPATLDPLLVTLGLAVTSPAASAGTYDVVSCGAPGAGGINRAWQTMSFDDGFWDVAASCPELSAWTERRPGMVAPNFTGAGFEINAPAVVLDKW